jgi:hypothetical protein
VTAAEACAIASMGVDFKVAEAVDSVQLIYGAVGSRKSAVHETVELLQEKAGVTAAEACAIASMGVDFMSHMRTCRSA